MFRTLLILLFFGCGPHTTEEYREEGRAVSRQLLENLQTIQTRADLKEAASQLKYLFDKMAELMIAAETVLDKNTLALAQKDRILSDQLYSELNRIYKIEGGRDFIEELQEDALNRLDAFEKTRG